MKTAEKKMLEFITEAIRSGGIGDTRATKGLLVLQLKYFYENVGIPHTAVKDSLEDLDRAGKICLFTLPDHDLDNVVIQLPIS